MPLTSPLAAAGLLDTVPLNVRNFAPGAAGRRAAERAAKDFESVLLHRLLEEMRRTIPESGLLESGISDQVQGLFYFYLSQEVANQGGLGVWKELYRQMAPQGGPAQEPPPASPPAAPTEPGGVER
jgi:Rod binding domain-containing protein